MTGCGGVGVELGGVGALEAGDVAGVLDHHALQAEAQAEGRDAVLAGVAAARRACPRCRGRRSRRARRSRRRRRARGAAPSGVGAVVGGDPADVDLRVVGEAAGAQRLGDRQVGVGQVDVLADQRDRDLVRRVVHPAQQLVPRRSSRRRGTAGRAGARRRRRGPRRAAPSGCRRSTARRPRRPRPPRRRRTSARSCA